MPNTKPNMPSYSSQNLIGLPSILSSAVVSSILCIVLASLILATSLANSTKTIVVNSTALNETLPSVIGLPVGVQTSLSKRNDLQAEASLLRPSLLKNFISNAAQKAAAKQGGVPAEGQREEDEEEVTQTIMVPIGNNGEAHGIGQQDGEQIDEKQQIISSLSEQLGSQGSRQKNSYQQIEPKQHRQQVSTAIRKHLNKHQASSLSQHLMSDKHQLTGDHIHQPKPEASLQLTSTEMSSLLNDREAPEFYRERELNGDGVVIGEEQQARLGMAASGHFGNPYMHEGGGAGLHSRVAGDEHDGAGAGDTYLNQQRLLHAASEEGGFGGGGFYHRFGSQDLGPGFGSGDEHLSGKLMQSPNEYQESAIGSMGSSDGSNYGLSGYGDYSPGNAGSLLRAGSGVGGESSLGGYEGGMHVYSSGGYSNSPMLHRDSSELYGGTEAGLASFRGGDMSSFYRSGRLAAAGSHHAGGLPFDEYSSRFGTHGGPPFEQRRFSTQNSITLNGNSALLNSRAAQVDGSDLSNANRLLPLSPTVPVGDELNGPGVAQSAQQETTMRKDPTIGVESGTPVHEPLEEDPTDASEPGETNNGEQSGSSEVDHQADVGSPDDDESSPQMQARSLKPAGQQNDQEPSLVINVPPPTTDSAIGQQSGGLSRPGAFTSPMIEFSRFGSAGYLPPSRRSTNNNRFVKKQGSRASYDPANNPAHAGKYIID